MTIAVTHQIRLPRPHSQGQLELASSTTSDVCFAGRRWGKTQVGVYRLLRASTKEVGLYWWVGLSWRSASMKRAWRLLKYYARKMYKALGLPYDHRIRESVHEIDLPNGSQIWLRTAEKEDSLAGEAIRGVVVDEFSLMAETVWTEYLEATLLDYNGWALFIGVPKGNNWAARLWRNAKTRLNWRAWHFTTYDNPHMSAPQIDEIRANVSSRLFEQEYLAQVLDDGGTVFRGVKGTMQPQPPKPHHNYVMGVDWGRVHDFTVLVIIDETTREVVALDRFNQVDWELQRGRLATLANQYRPRVILAESNSIGEPNIEALQKQGYDVQPFQTTNASKAKIIDELALGIEREELALSKVL